MFASDHELIARALDGDPLACRALVERLAPVIQTRVNRALERWAAFGRGRDIRQEMVDLIQEVFLALFAREGRVLRSWDPERGASLENFIGLVAEREVRGVLRSRRRNPWTEDPTLHDDFTEVDDAPLADRRVASREVLVEVYDRLQLRLSAQGLALFEALVVEGRPVPWVAARFEMSRDAIYAWRTRLRRTMITIADEITAEREGAA